MGARTSSRWVVGVIDLGGGSIEGGKGRKRVSGQRIVYAVPQGVIDLVKMKM